MTKHPRDSAERYKLFYNEEITKLCNKYPFFIAILYINWRDADKIKLLNVDRFNMTDYYTNLALVSPHRIAKQNKYVDYVLQSSFKLYKISLCNFYTGEIGGMLFESLTQQIKNVTPDKHLDKNVYSRIPKIISEIVKIGDLPEDDLTYSSNG